MNQIKENKYLEKLKEIYSNPYLYAEDFHIEYYADRTEVDLSIVTPAYNAIDYIEECIKSVIRQNTKYTYEFIIINDGSTDSTLKVINKYKENKQIKIVSQKNKGFSGARNIGIDLCKGKYIMFLDSDDRLPNSNIIEILLEEAFQFDVDIVQGGYQEFNRQGTTGNIQYRYEKGSSNKLKYAVSGYPWGKVYRRNLFKHVRFPEGFWFEDTVIHYIVVRLSKTISFIPEYVYDYRINENGITKNAHKKPKALDTLWIIKYLEENARSLSLRDSDEFYIFLLNHMSITSLRRIRKLNIEKDYFFAISSFIKEKNYINEHKLPMLYNIMDYSLKNQQYKKWRYVSNFIWIKEKLNNKLLKRKGL